MRPRPSTFAAAVLLLSAAGTAGAVVVERVEIVGLDEEMTENVRVSLALVDAIGTDVGWRRFSYMLREAEAQTREALEPFGFYSPTIVVERDGAGAGGRRAGEADADDDGADDATVIQARGRASITIRVDPGRPARPAVPPSSRECIPTVSAPNTCAASCRCLPERSPTRN
jgi:hypothetical protein